MLGIGLAGASAGSPVGASPPDERAYWVGVELGSSADESRRVAALARLQIDPQGVPASPAEASATVVGKARGVQAALAWVLAHAFADEVGNPEEPTLLREIAAPVPGGATLDEFGVPVLALWIGGSDGEDGLRAIGWPRAAEQVLPAGTAVEVAELVPARAPMFGAPAPRLPPARERLAIADRSGYVLRLGSLDRCDGEGSTRTCLRWAQVVARVGDRFFAGYLPAFVLADPAQWVRGRTAYPAVQTVYAGVRDGRAQILVLAHGPDGARHHKRLEAPLIDDRFPAVSVGLAGNTATVSIEDQAPVRLPLDATLDRFPRD